MELQVDLADPLLFGNDAAEDEAEDVFESYVLDREETAIFTDPTRQISIVRAYKGEGKSALLRLSRSKVMAEVDGDTEVFVIAASASDLVPREASVDLLKWVRAWKVSILDRIASEIGSRIGYAWRDGDMALVEQAERQGFKERNLVSSVLSRIKVNVSAGGVSAGVGIEGSQMGGTSKIVERWAAGRQPIWLFIDDVDQNFTSDRLSGERVATFFSAVRELSNAIPELRFRLAIRPNVWSALKFEYDSLSHVEQYVFDLSWSENSFRSLLARRIEGHWRRASRFDEISRQLGPEGWQRERRVLEAVFGKLMPWGGTVRPAHVVLYTLSKHRPRWLIELCKLGAKSATERGARQISLEDLMARLEEFGRRRIQDTSAEFRAQCPEMEELITAFNSAPEEMSTDELLGLIRNRILTHLTPTIRGPSASSDQMGVAHLLFQVGFIFAREDLPDGTYRHVAYAEKPTLLKSRSAVDEGMRWEVHPIFRQALGMRDTSGREVQRPRRGD